MTDFSSIAKFPDIMSDAAYIMLTRDAKTYTGNFAIDEKVLAEEGMTDFSQYAAVPGTTEFMPDFFLDDFDDFYEGKRKAVDSTAAPKEGIAAVFEQIGGVVNEEMVGKIKAVYAFDIKGKEAGQWYLDLKNGAGSCGAGVAHCSPDVTMSLKDTDFTKMFSGKLKPTTAFMTGKLQTKSFHTMPNHQRAYDQMFKRQNFSNGFHTSVSMSSEYKAVSEVLDRIKGVASEAIVKQVGAIYLFDVKEKGKYYIDFKNGSGQVGEGDPASKADVTITMNEEIFLKIFNRELAPATAFMTGKVKVSGDLSKALTLEKVMKATREAAEANRNKQG